jgi:hypothetical protein
MKTKSLKKTVATATTAEALSATSIRTAGAIVKAEASNTGIIYVGDSAVAAANGYELAAGEFVSFGDMESRGTDRDFDLDSIYIDASVSTDGVSVLYLKEGDD